MVALQITLTLLLSAASAIPTSAPWPEYDINGQLQDLALDRRAPAICQPNDKDIVALRSNKAAGSAFCSTYLQSTKTITTTPLVTSDMTKMVTKTAILVQIQRVHVNVNHIVRTKVMKTLSTVVTETQTATVTDFSTQTITNTMTDLSTDTDTTQMTETQTQQLTDVVTEQVTQTITKTIDLTSTVDVTDIDTQEITVSVPTTVTVTVTVTGAAPTTSVGTEYHCAIAGYGHSSYSVGSSSANTFDACKTFCQTKQGAVSFGFGPGACACYNQPAAINTNPNPASSYKFYDFGCPSASKPAKRAVSIKQVPSYLPLKDPSVVSSACSCHISNKPAAAKTQTVAAKETKTVTNMAKEYTTSYIKKKQVTTIYNQVTRMATDFKTLAVTNRDTKSVTQRKSATTTKPVTVTVTNYTTVVVTNYNTVGVTNRYTIQTTNYNTASATAYNSVFVTNVDYLTVTEYGTVVATDVVTNTVILAASGADPYVWGS
ncbi:uncharacterized protein FSUBG_5903 [Fusarium subglutinans]|uniref:WSC domain-containing protein n=1 Tax=Gibberella subglutinans TaxID=42677 RepID=A0A8H5Q111_GIBSU|nr:uncharacterized protein FSUBG_5903 [Fusarium subglutinans]KAF5606717.1 hypothetical protein FSUBG_5903 [Fusarium subglutinans]